MFAKQIELVPIKELNKKSSAFEFFTVRIYKNDDDATILPETEFELFKRKLTEFPDSEREIIIDSINTLMATELGFSYSQRHFRREFNQGRLVYAIPENGNASHPKARLYCIHLCEFSLLLVNGDLKTESLTNHSAQECPIVGPLFEDALELYSIFETAKRKYKILCNNQSKLSIITKQIHP